MALARNLTLPLRITQALFAVVVLGLTAYVSNWWSNFWKASAPSEIEFLVFASVWSLIALAYLTVAPLKFPQAAHKFGILAAEVLTMIFWFAGFVALAAFLGNRICFGKVCNIAKASAVFAAFEWLVFSATTVLASLHVWRTRGGAPREAKPEMGVSRA